MVRHNMVGSMGQAGAAADIAVLRSILAPLQCKVVDRHCWATRDQPRGAIVTWIERTYHRRQRQAVLGRLTGPPRVFRTVICDSLYAAWFSSR